ncbi:MAG: hypothetical protein IT381_01090 [Deltaproteobacteria bacterium]|nr:hypothetical protein [Deltaproteobacteria bacterium]
MGSLHACKEKVAPASEPVLTSDRALVIITTELRGYVAPCGCTSNPLGGIAKLAQLVADKKRSHGEPMIVTAGNFLFESGASKATTLEQDEARARVVAEVYRDAGVLAQTPGPFDLMHGGGKLVRELKNPWLEDGAVVSQRAAELNVAFIGVRAPPFDPRALVVKVALARERNDAVVALTSLDWPQARALAQAVPDLDVVIAAAAGEPHAPQRLGGTLIVDAGEQGQRVGLLELVRGATAGSKRWAYYDGGALELSQLQRQLAAAESEIAALPKNVDPALKNLQMGRREDLARQIAELQNKPPPPPKERYLRYSLVPLTKKMPDDKSALAKMKAYNATLCESSKRATEGLECEKAPPGAPSYIGSAACGSCHAPALAQWKTTKHAHAVETLEEAGKLCDLSCIGCHTTGFNAAGGFCSPQKIGALPDVGCESCHGPGSIHAKTTKTEAPFVKAPGEALCLQCHTKEHSDLFDFKTYRPKILGPGHGAK